MLLTERPFLAIILLLSLAKLALAAPAPECVQGLLGTDVSLKQAQGLAAEWLNRSGKDVTSHLTNPWFNKNAERRHAEIWDMTGIPARLKQISTKGKVFRHYGPKEAIDAIKQSKVLMSGFVPYVEAAPGSYKKNWNDVTGAFLTLPDSSANTVGVLDARTATYVDVTLAEDVPVLELEAGLIYIIPMRPNFRDWVRVAYGKWKNGDDVSPEVRTMSERIEKSGGIENFTAAVPVQIVGEGK